MSSSSSELVPRERAFALHFKVQKTKDKCGKSSRVRKRSSFFLLSRRQRATRGALKKKKTRTSSLRSRYHQNARSAADAAFCCYCRRSKGCAQHRSSSERHRAEQEACSSAKARCSAAADSGDGDGSDLFQGPPRTPPGSSGRPPRGGAHNPLDFGSGVLAADADGGRRRF